MALSVSPNTTAPEGFDGPNPSHMATEETFEGWPGENVEAELDIPPETDEEEEGTEEETETPPESETDEEEAEEPDEEETEETDEEEEEESSDVKQYADVGKRGKERILKLIAEKKASETRYAALEKRVLEAEKRAGESTIANQIAESLARQQAIQAQAWEIAQRERQQQEHAAQEAAMYSQLQMRGYEPGNFAHELAIENMRKIDEFMSSMQPQIGQVEERHQQLEAQRQANEYMGQLNSHLDRSLVGLEVKPELRSWLRETAVELAMLHDTTADKAVEAAFRKANSLGVVPKRTPKPTKKAKAAPPEILKAVAKGANRSGRKPGAQTKGSKRSRQRSPEDEAFSETNDGEW